MPRYGKSECILRVDLPERLVDWAAPKQESMACLAQLTETLSKGVTVLGTKFCFVATKTEQRKSNTKFYLLACPSEHEPNGLLS